MDAEGARGIRAGCDDAAFCGASADEKRLTAPLRMQQFLDRRVEGVEVEAEDNARSRHN